MHQQPAVWMTAPIQNHKDHMSKFDMCHFCTPAYARFNFCFAARRREQESRSRLQSSVNSLIAVLADETANRDCDVDLKV